MARQFETNIILGALIQGEFTDAAKDFKPCCAFDFDSYPNAVEIEIDERPCMLLYRPGKLPRYGSPNYHIIANVGFGAPMFSKMPQLWPAIQAGKQVKGRRVYKRRRYEAFVVHSTLGKGFCVEIDDRDGFGFAGHIGEAQAAATELSSYVGVAGSYDHDIQVVPFFFLDLIEATKFYLAWS